jgi:UDP-N-acetylglucosamine:LPS N-acetylglucosamine transferase
MPRVLLVCSSGGHLYEMFSLYKDVWQDCERVWVTFKRPDSESMLKDEDVLWAHGPTHRNIKNLIRNIFLAFRIVGRVRPDAIVSTGSGVALPFLAIGKLFGIRVLFIESVTRTKNISLTGRMLYPIVDHFLVQSPELPAIYKKAKFVGRIF